MTIIFCASCGEQGSSNPQISASSEKDKIVETDETVSKPTIKREPQTNTLPGTETSTIKDVAGCCFWVGTEAKPEGGVYVPRQLVCPFFCPAKKKPGSFWEKLREGLDERKATRQATPGTDGEPIQGKSGMPQVKSEHDAQGNLTQTSTFGTDGEPILSKKGIAQVTFEYDARGNNTLASSFGTDGELILNQRGFARMKFEYDDRGHQTRMSFFGTDGEPIQVEGGAARVEWPHDAHGDLIAEREFDADGNSLR